MATGSQPGSEASLAFEIMAPAGRPRRASAAGFTLLETIFALFILCVGIAFLAATMGSTIRADANTQAQNAGLFLANQEAEQIVGAFRTFRTPCGVTFVSQKPCGTFVDIRGTTVNLADGGSISFASAGLTGYSEVVTIGGPNCGNGNGVAGCQEYELRWTIVTPINTVSGTQMQMPHQITVAARAAGGGMNFAPVKVYEATQ